MSQPTKYRKKPVVIEAMRLDRMNGSEVAAWCGGHHWTLDPEHEITSSLDITTLEGVMRAEVGDWIIRGVKGEFYPCKPDIFDATYEPAEATR